jgi:hypothetical protein
MMGWGGEFKGNLPAKLERLSVVILDRAWLGHRYIFIKNIFFQLLNFFIQSSKF